MAAIHSDAFKRDAVRIAQTNGLTRRQVASGKGVGFSTMSKWVKMVSDEAGPPDPDPNLLRENRSLKDLSRIRKQSGRLFSRRMWDLPKKGEAISDIGSTSRR